MRMMCNGILESNQILIHAFFFLLLIFFSVSLSYLSAISLIIRIYQIFLLSFLLLIRTRYSFRIFLISLFSCIYPSQNISSSAILPAYLSAFIVTPRLIKKPEAKLFNSWLRRQIWNIEILGCLLRSTKPLFVLSCNVM